MEDLRALVNFDTVIINILAENKARASYTLHLYNVHITTFIQHIVCGWKSPVPTYGACLARALQAFYCAILLFSCQHSLCTVCKHYKVYRVRVIVWVYMWFILLALIMRYRSGAMRMVCRSNSKMYLHFNARCRVAPQKAVNK